MGLLVDKRAAFDPVTANASRALRLYHNNGLAHPDLARQAHTTLLRNAEPEPAVPAEDLRPDPATIVPCFTVGSVIATTRGAVRAEDLVLGDQVITRDNGVQPIRWIGHKDIDGATLAQTPNLRPVLIRAGSLGQGMPERDLIVSPNHRILLSGEAITHRFGEHEVLASAKHLLDRDGVQQVDALRVRYIHFMFDQHEVVLSDGAWSESFQPSDISLQGVDAAQRDELFTLFPALRDQGGVQAYGPARRTLHSSDWSLLTR